MRRGLVRTRARALVDHGDRRGGGFRPVRVQTQRHVLPHGAAIQPHVTVMPHRGEVGTILVKDFGEAHGAERPDEIDARAHLERRRPRQHLFFACAREERQPCVAVQRRRRLGGRAPLVGEQGDETVFPAGIRLHETL